MTRLVLGLAVGFGFTLLSLLLPGWVDNPETSADLQEKRSWIAAAGIAVSIAAVVVSLPSFKRDDWEWLPPTAAFTVGAVGGLCLVLWIAFDGETVGRALGEYAHALGAAFLGWIGFRIFWAWLMKNTDPYPPKKSRRQRLHEYIEELEEKLEGQKEEEK